MRKKPELPGIKQIRAALLKLNKEQVQALSTESGASFSLLSKLRGGHIKNPGIETVRKFYPLLPDDAGGEG